MKPTDAERDAVARIAGSLPDKVAAALSGDADIAPDMIVNLAVALSFAGELEWAGRRFRQALLLTPGSLRALSGVLAHGSGDAARDERLTAALRGIGAGGDWMSFARDLTRAGRPGEAVAAYDQAKRADPELLKADLEAAGVLHGCFRVTEAAVRVAVAGDTAHAMQAYEWALQDDLHAGSREGATGHARALEFQQDVLERPSRDPAIFQHQMLMLLEPANAERFHQFRAVWPELMANPALASVAAKQCRSAGRVPEWMRSALPLAQLDLEVTVEDYRLTVNRADDAVVPHCSGDAIDTALRVHQFCNAEILSGEWIVLRPDGRAVLDSCFTLRPAERRAYSTRFSQGWLTIQRPPAEEVFDGKAVLVGFYANYYHWMVDQLPKLLGILTCPLLDDRRIIVAADVLPYVIELIDKLGVSADRLLPLKYPASIRVRDLAMVGFGPRPMTAAGHPVFFCSSLPTRVIAALRERLLRLFGVLPDISGGRRFFISRLDARYPRLENEREIFERLEPYGFEAVSLEGRPVAEQAAMFADAEIVVAAHGAGLTNTMFAPAGARVVELRDRHRRLDFFQKIAEAAGLDHIAVESTHTFLDPQARILNRYRVDPDDVVRVVTASLA